MKIIRNIWLLIVFVIVFFTSGHILAKNKSLILDHYKVSEKLYPFRDINDVTKIEVNEKDIIFFSRNGKRTLNKDTRTWDFEVNSKGGDDIYNKKVGTWADLPSWYTKQLIGAKLLINRVKSEINEYLLITVINEGHSPLATDIVDVGGEKVFRMPYQNYRTLAFDEPYLWVGHRRGITRVDHKTGKRTDFHIMPRFNKIAGWIEYNDIRYITTKEGDLMSLEIDTGNVISIPLPKKIVSDLLIEKEVQFYGPISIKSLAIHLTNPVIINGSIYIGAFPLNNLEGDSLLLIYNIDKEKWKHIRLAKVSGVRKLILLDGNLWCIGNWVAAGDDYYSKIGGISVLTKNGQLISYKDLSGGSVVGFFLKQNAIFILSEYYGSTADTVDAKKQFFSSKISLSNFKILERTEITDNENKLSKFETLDFTLSKKIVEQAFSWKVKLKIIEQQNNDIHYILKNQDNLDDLITWIQNYESPLNQEEIISRLVRIGKPALKSLVALLNSKNKDVIKNVKKAITGIEKPAKEEELISALNSPSISTKLNSVYLLGEMKSIKAIDEIYKIIKNENDTKLRCEAVKSLRKIKGFDSAKYLYDFLGDKDKSVRFTVASQLSKIKDLNVIDKFIELLGSQDNHIVETSFAGLVWNRAIAVEPLLSALNTSDLSKKAIIAQALGVIGDFRAVDPLIEMLGSDDVFIRYSTSIALGQLGHSSAVKGLILLLDDPSEKVVNSSIESLEKITSNNFGQDIQKWKDWWKIK